MRAIVYGPPCSGKTTISLTLCRLFPSLERLSFHAMCEAEARRGTAVGRLWRHCDQSGIPLPRVLPNILFARSWSAPASFVVDGYPKRLPEARFFVSMCGAPTHLFILHCDRGLVEARLRARWECPKCRASTSDKKAQCPVCGGPTIRRQDDSVLRWRKRFEQYLAYAQPAIEFLKTAAPFVWQGPSSALVAWLGDNAKGFEATLNKRS